MPVPSSRRLHCPRCGETFSFRAMASMEDMPPTSALPGEVPHSSRRDPRLAQPARLALSNRSIALGLLAFMIVLAIFSLVMFLRTESVRRGHDVEIPRARREPDRIRLALARNPWILGLVAVWISGLAYVLLKDRIVGRGDAEQGVQRNPLRFSLVFTVLAGVIAIAVVLLATQDGHDPGPPAESRLGSLVRRSVSPADLGALGYLPADTNVIAAIHLTEVMQEEIGRELLSRFPLANLGLADVEKWTELKREDLNHVALGLKIDGSRKPRLVLVAQTNRPYQAARIIKALKAQPLPGGEKQLYQFTLEKPALKAVLWFPTDETLIVCLSAQDLEAVPLKPVIGGEQLAEPLRHLFRERMDKVNPAWVIGHLDNGDNLLKSLPIAGLLGTLKPEDRKALMGVRSFGIWIQLEAPLTVRATVSCTDEAAAQDLEQALDQWRLKKPEEYVIHRKEQWVTVQVKISGETLRRGPAEEGNPAR